jgi:hypothetical protein
MTKAEGLFVDQMTRKLLVDWCARQVGEGSPFGSVLPSEPFVEYAIEKGWLSKDRTRVLAGGFTTAASFLRR